MHSVTPCGRCGRYGSTPAVTVCTSFSRFIAAINPGMSGTGISGGIHTSTSSAPSGAGPLPS
ncbi:hypothetical protein [Nonomuraea dietziae]|uniref:hypothetical protein n=1 Tax=Nonomuraea dietziae TaxID=65515 RepID=UPI0031E22E75